MAVLDIEAIKARVNAATSGPWEHYRGKLRPQFGTRINEVRSCDDSCAVVAWPGFDDSARDEKEHAANAKFIAHTRTDVPALLARVAELEAAQEWQPISTAPQDNSYILIWSGCWRHPFAGRYIGDGFVLIDGADIDATQTKYFATHWMPLPSLPEREQERQ